MGVTEEAGKIAANAVEGLKTNPSCLAAIALAAIFAVLTYFSLTAQRTEAHERQMMMLERCFPLDRTKQ